MNCFNLYIEGGVNFNETSRRKQKFRKAIAVENPKRNVEATNGNYFDTRIYQGHVPYMKYFPSEMHEMFPSCLMRFYTLSEIINSAIKAGFNIKEFNEHPKYDDAKSP